MLTLTLILLTSCSVIGRSDGSGTRVLFVGNSLTYYNDLPAMVRALDQSTRGQNAVDVEMLAQGGFSVADFLKNERLQEELTERRYQFIVIQDIGGWPLCASYSPPKCTESLQSIEQLAARAQTLGTRVIWYSTWQRFPASQRQLSSLAQVEAQKMRVLVADVGAAMLQFSSSNPTMPVVLADGHPTALGSWLAAISILSALRGEEPPVGLRLRRACRQIWQARDLKADRLASEGSLSKEDCSVPEQPVLLLLLEAASLAHSGIAARE